LVTRFALDENLLAQSRVLGMGMPRDDCEDSSSEHENETAHPTISMADKEYARAHRSNYFANRLRSQNDSIALKDLLAKSDLKSPRPFMSTHRWPISPAS
jgi:hypothetical protein